MTPEQKAAQAILQKPIRIKVGKKYYNVAPPTTATLIEVSAAISDLPQFIDDHDKVVQTVLANAQDCRVLGDVLAILILGAKGLTVERPRTITEERKVWWGLRTVTTTKEVVEQVDVKAELAATLLDELSPQELNTTISNILARLGIADFFALTTFLHEVNILKPRKVVKTNETTPSGRSSRGSQKRTD